MVPGWGSSVKQAQRRRFNMLDQLDHMQVSTPASLSPAFTAVFSYAIGPIDPAQITSLHAYLSTGDECSLLDRKSTRLNSSHPSISYAVFCLKKKKKNTTSRIANKKKKTKRIKQTRRASM